MDLSKIRAALDLGRQTLQALEPLAGIGGPAVAQAAAITLALIEVGQKGLETVETGAEVMGSTDEARIREILAELQADNDRLAQIINTPRP